MGKTVGCAVGMLGPLGANQNFAQQASTLNRPLWLYRTSVLPELHNEAVTWYCGSLHLLQCTKEAGTQDGGEPLGWHRLLNNTTSNHSWLRTMLCCLATLSQAAVLSWHQLTA
jgi:hypothetical protein